MINPGKYNKKISIYKILETEDDDGFKIKTESIILKPFAKVKTTKGFTLIANGSDFEKAYTNFTIRYSKKVEENYYSSNRKLYVKYKNKIYSVEYLNNLDEANIELEIQAKKGRKIMARFQAMIPTELIKEFEEIYDNTFEMMGEMTKAGAQKVYKNLKSNIGKSFKTSKSLNKGLTITRVYRTPSDDGINCKVGFYGYDTSKKTKKYPNGIPIPLIALAREYGTSSGENKKPFFRKSFKKSEIEEAMKKVQEKYLPKE